jgi:hypothetical protein
MHKNEIKTIWQVPKYLPFVQPILTDSIVEDAERQIGYKLPKEYLELLKIQNGGYIRYSLKDIPHRQIFGIGTNYPSITDYQVLNDYDNLSFETNDLFPFDGDGHWYICLDYRKNKIVPEVTYIDTELDHEKVIAPSFSDYLNLLEIETGNQFVIETNFTFEIVLKQLSDILNIKFEEPDYWAHGYAVHRSKFKNSWIWVSPNIAPASFIREDDDRYTELKSQMNTTGLRYSEIPERSLVISFSVESIQQELYSKLKTNGIEIKELKDYLGPKN